MTRAACRTICEAVCLTCKVSLLPGSLLTYEHRSILNDFRLRLNHWNSESDR